MSDDPARFTTLRVAAVIAVAVVAAAGAAVLQPAQAAPILALGGVLIVAFVTWISADARQARALEAERDRQAAALAHARELADLADLRALLDSAVADLHQAAYVRLEVAGQFLRHGLHILDRAYDTTVKFAEVIRTLDALTARLIVRLGREHDATKAFATATADLREVAGALMLAHGDDTPLEERGPLRKQINAAGKGFDAHRRLFEDAATKLAGTRLTPN